MSELNNEMLLRPVQKRLQPALPAYYFFVSENPELGLVKTQASSSLAAHLRNGSDIRRVELEPALTAAAQIMRGARLSGAVDDARVTQITDEIDRLVDQGREHLASTTVECGRLLRALDVAKLNQRRLWLVRCQKANPDADLRVLIRECEMKAATAKLAYATSKGEKP